MFVLSNIIHTDRAYRTREDLKKLQTRKSRRPIGDPMLIDYALTDFSTLLDTWKWTEKVCSNNRCQHKGVSTGKNARLLQEWEKLVLLIGVFRCEKYEFVTNFYKQLVVHVFRPSSCCHHVC